MKSVKNGWQLEKGKGVPEDVKPLDIAGMVKDHITVLAFQQKLKELEDTVLNKFKDVFKPIPDVRNLPTDITAQIKIKNTEKTITSWTYACPCKF